MKVKKIDFPQPIIKALRDNLLVVFAGAGVSKNPPANLPTFSELSKKIVQGTGETQQDGETEDHFLGRLQQKDVKVHEEAAEILRKCNPEPTNLHSNLLCLYTAADKVRIVTTNFDLLFEQAAKKIFEETKPEVFSAPALPLGKNFQGIVHVHGDINHPNGMVITDADFGRGYLSEGWARRFLLELFQKFTVLFVGYSHNDTMMDYLARALPPNNTGKRYVLIEAKGALERAVRSIEGRIGYVKEKEELERWQGLGITPIKYPNHQALDEGIQKLAKIIGRGYLEWHQVISKFAGKPPPLLDEESIDNIKHALADKGKIHFFTNNARSPEWVNWLDKEDYLNNLFRTGELIDEDREYAKWLAEHFTDRYADVLFSLIFKHDYQLNPKFWWELGLSIGKKRQNALDIETLARWVSLLLYTIPSVRNDYVISNVPLILKWIGERCIECNLLNSLIQVFYALTRSYLQFYPPEIKDSPKSVYSLKNLWEKGLKPHLADVAQPLVELVTIRLKEQYSILHPWWQQDSLEYILSRRRAKIECYEYDRFVTVNDILINAIRDCLGWLMVNQKDVALQWCVAHIKSEVPLLRRLAVHALSGCKELSANQKINWFLEHLDIYDLSIHHEIFIAIRLAYIEADMEHRKKIVDTILAYYWPNEKDSDKERRTAYHHFNWLIWLKEKVPSCKLFQHALDDIKKQYPDFQKRKNPDLLNYAEVKSNTDIPSPWTVEELLAMSPDKCLQELLPIVCDEYNARCVFQEAVKKKFQWGDDLANVLAKDKKWNERIWSFLIRAWSEIELNEAQCQRVLRWLDEPELYLEHSLSIANTLYALVKDTNRPYILTLLPQAHNIAAKLWHYIVKRNEPPEQRHSWSNLAINDPAGILTLFWLFSLSLYKKQKDPAPNTFSEEYRQIFSNIINESTSAGILGRSILASHFSFLLASDEEWTKQNLLPLFNKDADTEDFQVVWDGFLSQSNLNPAVAELFNAIFIRAIHKINSMSGRNREEFINIYTTMLIYFVTNPLEKWIPEIFRCDDNKEIRNFFASSVEIYLMDMNDEQQRKLWKQWLKGYWENRLKNKPDKLEPEEIKLMLLWLPDLSSIFPEAVELAIKMPTASLEQSWCVESYFDKGELLKNYPGSLAKLLIYLGEWDRDEMTWYRGQEIIDKLLKSNIPPQLKRKLKELSAKLNLPGSR